MADIDITNEESQDVPSGGDRDITDESDRSGEPDPSKTQPDQGGQNPDGWTPDTDTDSGTPGGAIVNPVTPGAPDSPSYVARTRTVTNSEIITDFSAASIAAYQGSGAVPYAVLSDGTEVRVNWIDVYDPAGPATVIENEAADVAEATNQHFWHRSTDPNSDGAGTGAFVTDDEQDDFLEAAAQGFPDATKSWHNLLMNSLGILLRTGLKNLVSITKSAIAFYDGDGNAASNIVARFGKSGVNIGTGSLGVRIEDDLISFDLDGSRAFDVSYEPASTSGALDWQMILSFMDGLLYSKATGSTNQLNSFQYPIVFKDGSNLKYWDGQSTTPTTFPLGNGQASKSTIANAVTTASGITLGSSTFTVTGYFAMWSCSIEGSITGNGVTIATIASAANRPVSNVVVPLCVENYTSGYTEIEAWLRIETSGAIRMYVDHDAARISGVYEFAFDFSASWIRNG